MQLWEWVWILLCMPTPKPMKGWRVMWFRIFGGVAGKGVYLHPRARIDMPWNVTLANGVTLGDRAHVYALGPVRIGDGTAIAQESYVCAGTHDFADPSWPLVTPPVSIGAHCFLGLRTVVLPGVTIGDHVLLGANSLVTRDIPVPGTYAGQPAKKLSDQAPC